MHDNTKYIPSRLGEENKDDIWRRFADFLSDVIARHIDEMDMDSLPSYACLAKMDELYASYERLHLLKNENRYYNTILPLPEKTVHKHPSIPQHKMM